MSRLFLDANVILDGIIARWGLSKAVLSLCAARIHKLLLARYVIGEAERALLYETSRLSKSAGDRLLNDYDRFLSLARPQVLPFASEPQVEAAMPLIKHIHDAPVLAAAIEARPDWLLSRNRKHFDRQVSARTGLRVVSPEEFFRVIHAAA